MARALVGGVSSHVPATQAQNSIGADFRGDVLVPPSVGPHPGLQPTFHHHTLALAQVLGDPLAQRGPGHHLMPFGLALSLAGSLRDDLMRGHGEARHFLLIAERSDFWITPQVPDQDHVIDHCPTPPAARAFPKASPATERFHLGSPRYRRTDAPDTLRPAQPRAPP